MKSIATRQEFPHKSSMAFIRTILNPAAGVLKRAVFHIGVFIIEFRTPQAQVNLDKRVRNADDCLPAGISRLPDCVEEDQARLFWRTYACRHLK